MGLGAGKEALKKRRNPSGLLEHMVVLSGDGARRGEHEGWDGAKLGENRHLVLLRTLEIIKKIPLSAPLPCPPDPPLLAFTSCSSCTETVSPAWA